MCPSPTLWWRMPHFSWCWTPATLQAHCGRWHHTCLLWLGCLFIVCVGKCPSPPSGAFHMTATVTSFLHSKVAWQVPPLLPSLASFFIYSSHEGVPLLHSLELRAPCPLCYMSFFFQLLVCYSVCFFLLSLGRSQSVQGAMLICPRVVCGSIVCCLFAHLWVCQAG
jgi:hypothetical protein